MTSSPVSRSTQRSYISSRQDSMCLSSFFYFFQSYRSPNKEFFDQWIYATDGLKSLEDLLGEALSWNLKRTISLHSVYSPAIGWTHLEVEYWPTLVQKAALYEER